MIPVALLQADPDHHYPKLRVRHSSRSDNSVSYSLISEDLHSLDDALRSFDASLCSDEHSSRTSDVNFVQLTDFEEKFLKENFSMEPSISTTDFSANDQHKEKDAEEQDNENLSDQCKEVQCIEVEEPGINKHLNLNMPESSPYRYEDSNMPSSDVKMDTFELTKVWNDDRANQELVLPLSKGQKKLNGLQSTFIITSPEKPSPLQLEASMSESRSIFIRSRSCRARLMNNLPVLWFEMGEKNDTTPSFEFEKDFPGRPERFQRKFSALKYDLHIERLSRNDSQNYMSKAAVDDIKKGNVKTSTDWKSASSSSSDAGIMHGADDLVSASSIIASRNRSNSGYWMLI